MMSVLVPELTSMFSILWFSSDSSVRMLVTFSLFINETNSKSVSRIWPSLIEFNARTDIGSKQTLFMLYLAMSFVNSDFKSSIEVAGENFRNFTWSC